MHSNILPVFVITIWFLPVTLQVEEDDDYNGMRPTLSPTEALLARGYSPFYWQPKLMLKLISSPKEKFTSMVVLLRGYKLGITTMTLVEGIPERHRHHQLHPMKVPFYTDTYRWFRRYTALLPMWIYGESGHYYETLKLWRSRFMYADVYVPRWIQRMLFYIPPEDWEKERKFFAKFTEIAGDTYARQMRFNDGTKKKSYDWLSSHESDESAENLTPPTTTNSKEMVTPSFKNYTAFVEPDEAEAPWNWNWNYSTHDLSISPKYEWYYENAPWSWNWRKTNEKVVRVEQEEWPHDEENFVPKRKPGLMNPSYAIHSDFADVSAAHDDFGDDKRNGSCFPEGSMVQTPEGTRDVASLRPGDLVLAAADNGKLHYSKVITFLDREPNTTRQFVQITAAGGVRITATAAHLLLLSDDAGGWREMFAGEVRRGDALLVTSGGHLVPAVVEHVVLVMQRGAYAPLTQAGTVVVDGALASCYAVVTSHALAHAALTPLRWAHTVGATSMDILTGVHWYAKTLHEVSRFIMPDSYKYDTNRL